MKNKSLYASVFLVISLFSIGVGYGLYYFENREGLNNIAACEALKPGISIQELEDALGGHIDKQRNKNSMWLSFKTPSINAGRISAEVNETTGMVVTLRCYHDGPATWHNEAS